MRQIILDSEFGWTFAKDLNSDDPSNRLHLGSISPTFYAQLFCSQIPKAQKDSQVKQLFTLLGSGSVKATHNMLVKLTPGRESG